MVNGCELLLQDSRAKQDFAQAEDRVAQAIEELATELTAGKSDRLIRFLQFMARFHRYSFGNCMLICAQRENASLVAGYRMWQKLGRQVKKGERSIGIFAPMTRKVVEADAETQDDVEREETFGFRRVSVFDISQTDGEPLPSISRTAGDAARLVPAIERIIESLGFSVTYESLDWGTGGSTDGRRITVGSDQSLVEQFRVLVHELAHIELDHFSRRLSKTVRETEAEAVACVVAHAFSIDAMDRSRDYIHLYDGDRETLMDSLSAIQRTAGRIISLLDAELGTDHAPHELSAY